MKTVLFRTLSLLLLLSLVLPLLLSIPVSAADENHATVIFTHDLHSHFLPTPTDHGGEVGGYAPFLVFAPQRKKI